MSTQITISTTQFKKFKKYIVIFQEILSINDLVQKHPLPKNISPYNRKHYLQKRKTSQRILRAATAIGQTIANEGSLEASEYYLFMKLQSSYFQTILDKNILLKKYPLFMQSNDTGLSLGDYVVQFSDFVTQLEQYLGATARG